MIPRSNSFVRSEVDPDHIKSTYKILEVIKRGGFSTVRDAIHRETKQRVALKVTHKEKASKRQLEDARREARLLKKLQGEHILPVYDVFECDKHIVVVLKQLSMTLWDYVDMKGSLEEAEAIFIFQKLFSAVSYCHSKGIIHKDLKPENVLISIN